MTAIVNIVNWVNEENRPIWLRHAMRLLLDNNELEEEDYKLLFRLARIESGFSGELELADYSSQINADGYGIEESSVVLKKLGPMKHVGNVPDSEALEFSETGMTVIYGHNGSGKSSYVRILKNVCLTRGDKPDVISNVFEDELYTPEAAIGFRVGELGTTHVTWSASIEDIPELM